MPSLLLAGQADWSPGLSASYKRAFQQHGWTVEAFSIDQKMQSILPLGAVGRRVAGHFDLPSFSAQANRAFLRRAMDLGPDVVLVAGNEPLRTATLMQLKVCLPRTRVVNVFPDSLHNMREQVIAALPLYDLFCTHTRAGVEILKRMGCPRPLYVPLAADTSIRHPYPLSDSERARYACDLAYVGNWRPEHEALFEALGDFDVKIWGGTYWGTKTGAGSVARRAWQRESPSTVEGFAKAHMGARICLNPIDPMNFPGHNQRLFEMPALGVFTLVSRTDEVIDLFDEGEDVVCFASPQELVEKARHYLPRGDERARIAKRAHERVVRGGNTFVDRARTIIDALAS